MNSSVWTQSQATPGIFDTISHQPIEEPVLIEINPPYRPSRPNSLPAIPIWLAFHRLSSILATLAASHPQTSPSHHNSPPHSISPRIRHPKPSNQAAYDGWLPHAYKHVFRCEQALTGPIIAIEAPEVEGLSVYGARNGQTKFYGRGPKNRASLWDGCGCDRTSVALIQYTLSGKFWERWYSLVCRRNSADRTLWISAR